MALSKDQVMNLYRKRADNYDISANLYYLIGFRESKYRKLAVRELMLKSGDTVVEIGCGTGLNFRYIIDAVGPEGKLIGVDLTDKMLAGAKARVSKNGWANVELVQKDASTYRFPDSVSGIISTFAITLIPEYKEIIRRGADALAPQGRMVIADLCLPDRWPMWMARLMVWVTKPFGTSLDIARRQPWKAIETYLAQTTFRKIYGGFAYISSGMKSP